MTESESLAVIAEQRASIVLALHRYVAECFPGPYDETTSRLLGAVADRAIAEAFAAVETRSPQPPTPDAAIAARHQWSHPMNRKPNNALSAVREFMRNVGGDIRILHRELQNDPESKIALEEVGRFLMEAAQELAAGSTPKPESAGVPLADMVPRPEPQQAPQPQDESAVAALLAKLNGA